jgi:dimethylaniline monooxygenase (N-oxide forming)
MHRWIHNALEPVKWVWWRVVELMFRVQFGLKGDLLPDVPIELDVFNGGQILTYEMRDLLAENKMSAIKTTISRFTEKSVILTNGTEIECDMVVYGTGFKKSYHLFDQIIQRKLDLEKDGLYLYRNMIPPKVPNLAFIGCEVSTFNNILTHGLQAQWLQRVLSGKVVLPCVGKMSQALELEQAWKRSWMPPTNSRASIWQLHMMQYHDSLCQDMGIDHRRKGLNPLAELFVPYEAADYAAIFDAKETKTPGHMFMVADVAMLASLLLIYYFQSGVISYGTLLVASLAGAVGNLGLFVVLCLGLFFLWGKGVGILSQIL